MPDIESKTILYDQEIRIDDERHLRLIFDLATTITKSASYVDEFTSTRQLPFDLENISPRDSVLMYVVSHFNKQLKAKLITEQAIMHRVVQYYSRAKEDVSRDSMIIALFSHPDNLAILSEEPEPYPTVETEADPLVLQMPVIQKNLTYPTERRLKRLMDLLIETGAIFRVEALLSTLSVRINSFAQGLVEVDEGGFPPAGANREVFEEAQPSNGKRKVQKASTTS